MTDARADEAAATLTQIFADANAVKVQYLASALDEAAIPFTLHETWTDTVETGGQEHRLLVREGDVDAAKAAILTAVAELPDRQAALDAAFPDDEPEDASAVDSFTSVFGPLGWVIVGLLAAWSLVALTGTAR